jgi:NADH dehydrogenase [ubiquinone] 1 alpha subcomplex assembly factor 7
VRSALDILGGMGDARDAVVAAIRDHGPISFAEYMELALYGPGGFYEDPPIGADRDFVTSPHIHPIFGTLVARAIAQLRDALGDPAPFRLVEVGAGDGTLARQLIDQLAGDRLEYTAVERSPGARAALDGVVGVRVAEDIPRDAHVILANELLDNLPFRCATLGPVAPAEVRIGLDAQGEICEMRHVDESGELATALAGLPMGTETVIPDGIDAFLERVANTFGDRGYALLIDYGDLGPRGGSVHGYRAQRVVDLTIHEPGMTDITAGVDFAGLADHAENLGLVAFPTVTQFEALRALGFETWARQELARQHALLDARDADAVRAWSARSRASLLVDPAHLGRFRWLLLATPGLPEPGWLRQALVARDTEPAPR